MDAKSPSSEVANSGSEAGIVAASVYAGGKRVAGVASRRPANGRNGRATSFGSVCSNQAMTCWPGCRHSSICIPSPSKTPASAHQHPKLEQYGEALFIVAPNAQIVDERIAFGETHIFMGRGYVVTVRHGASSSYAAVRGRCELCPSVLSPAASDYILYAILDFIVDNYMPVVETVNDEVEAIKDRVFDSDSQQGLDGQRLYMLRRDLLRLRNAATPLVNVCRGLEHAEVMSIDPTMQPLFRDVTDHVLRVQEEIDMLARGAGVRVRGEPDERVRPSRPASPAAWQRGPPFSQCRRRLPGFTA